MKCGRKLFVIFLLFEK